jgi:hypothetical protein
MDKKNLQSILSAPFTIPNWRDVLVSVFGAKRLHQNPIPIDINKKEKAEAAFELGSFNTSDDRIIGLYLVKVKPEVGIERNKVGLREMLRSVYKHDVDGALIVFEQKDKWRLSFVSEIRVFDENGKISKKITEPKRYTYLLGADEKVKTPATRLASLSGKPFSLEDIRNAFSVEALNEEFYKVVARYFYQLVGATEGKGAKAVTHPRILELPGIKPDNNEGHKIYQEFAVRLIGRTVFCWFLKVKKSDKGIALLPEHLLSNEAATTNSNYYHFILEKLFFQTLNTPMGERLKGLPKGCEQIPFLNGGLFEPQTEDYYKPNRTTGLSDNLNTLKIPDSWFKDFFEHLEQYNFTIDENSVVDIEVSVDPEMLGRIFENLLAEIDPDSGDTARNATGSFYTPREIVDYMATESLVHFLHNQTKINKESLLPIFKMDSEVSFPKAEAEKILEALDRLKIIDPACGSGAFPIGVMQKIVMALQKLDKEAVWWKAKQIQRIENAILRKQVKQKLEQTTVEYARKIGIIQNSLYGVDIQPIAAEISKLRCFLTLVVDENIDETKPNRGVEPLPNLEFKFVTADALLKLPDEGNYGGLFNANEDIDLLQQIRLDYLQSYGHHKQELKDEFEKVRDRIAKQQLKLGKNIDINSRAYKISSWNPFGHDKVDWFDPMWMYGVKEFDIVIGNPPYVSAVSMARNAEQKQTFKSYYPEATGAYDNYILFLLRTLELCSCCYTWIIPNKFLIADYAKQTRNKLINNGLLYSVDVSSFNVFKSASVYPIIILGLNKNTVVKEFKELLLEKYEDLSLRDFKLPTKLRSHRLFIDSKIRIGSGATGFEAQKIKGLLTEESYKGSIPFVVSGNIDRYTFTNKDVRYMGNKYSKAFIRNNGEIAGSKWAFWSSPKIVIAGMTKKIEAVFVKEPLGLGVGVYAIFDWGKHNPQYITALLNSKYLSYYMTIKYKDKHLAGGYLAINKSTIEGLPFIECNSENVFNALVDYIIFLNSNLKESPINEFVPNSHIIQLFEEVIDALVYELYFDEDFKKAGISFMKFAERDFKRIDGKNEKEAIKIIRDAYQKLREKDNEIRQNLKLMDTRLADLIMPIKTAK